MRRTNKKGFTIVELVIVIAVIAILAAVLIPTFASIVNKANESAALADARNMANQLLMYLMDQDGANGKDLVILQEKSGEIYVHAYCISEGRVVAYKGNAITDTEGETFDERVEAVLTQLMGVAALEKTEDPAEDSWAHPDNMKKIVEQLGYDPENTAFRANYKVELVAFEAQSVPAEHVCSAVTLEKREAQKPSCRQPGWDEYYICTVCGEIYSDAQGTQRLQLKIEDPTAHTYGNTYTLCDAENHYKECTVCGTRAQEDHQKVPISENGKYYDTCKKCSWKEETSDLTAEYKLAIDLNAILAKNSKRNSTMYDAFSFVCSNSGSDKYNDIQAVISAIDTAEKGKSGIVVWDQIVDRFCVLEKDSSDVTGNKYYVRYSVDGTTNGLRQVTEKQTQRYWDVYNDTNQPTLVTIGYGNYHSFSVYWNGKEAPSVTNKITKRIEMYAGFDAGEWEPTAETDIVIRGSRADGNGDTIVRTTNQYFTVTRSDQVSRNPEVSFYGVLGTLEFNSKDKQTWHLHANISKIENVANKQEDIKELTVTVYDDTKIDMTEADFKSLGFIVTGNGCTFKTTD